MFAAIVEATKSGEVSRTLFGQYTSRDVFMKEIAKTGAIPHGTDEFYIRHPNEDLSIILHLRDVGDRALKAEFADTPLNPPIPYRNKMVSDHTERSADMKTKVELVFTDSDGSMDVAVPVSIGQLGLMHDCLTEVCEETELRNDKDYRDAVRALKSAISWLRDRGVVLPPEERRYV